MRLALQLVVICALAPLVASNANVKINPLYNAEVPTTQCGPLPWKCGPGTGFGCEKGVETPMLTVAVSSGANNISGCQTSSFDLKWNPVAMSYMSPIFDGNCTYNGTITVTVSSACWQKSIFKYGGKDYASATCSVTNSSTGYAVKVNGDLYDFGGMSAVQRAVANVHSVECMKATDSKFTVMMNSGFTSAPTLVTLFLALVGVASLLL
jgi:hypothetical protein